MNRNTYAYQKLRGMKRKLYLIEQRGGRCESCGYDKNLAAFDFHHKDPTEKDHGLDMRKLSNMSMENILVEFDKCEVLCANCHREKHSPELEIKNVRILVEQVSDSLFRKVESNQPKCVDCDILINYNHTRCRPCSDKNKRKVERPDLGVLQKELDDHGVTWCSRKYGVARGTVKKWLRRGA